MEQYDPLVPVSADDWFATDEEQRITLVESYHRENGPEIPNLRMHAVVHVVVENRLAEGDRATTDALERLRGEGLDRHDAVHAIGTVVLDELQAAVDGGREEGESGEDRLTRRLDELTAEAWYREFE